MTAPWRRALLLVLAVAAPCQALAETTTETLALALFGVRDGERVVPGASIEWRKIDSERWQLVYTSAPDVPLARLSLSDVGSCRFRVVNSVQRPDGTWPEQDFVLSFVGEYEVSYVPVTPDMTAVDLVLPPGGICGTVFRQMGPETHRLCPGEWSAFQVATIRAEAVQRATAALGGFMGEACPPIVPR